MLYIFARSPTNSCGAKLEHSSFILPRTLTFVLEWRGGQPDSQKCYTHPCCPPYPCRGPAFGCDIWKSSYLCRLFGTRSVLAQNFLVMKFIHCYFGQFEYGKAEIDRTIDDYFRFFFFNWYEIFCYDVPVECGGSYNEFFARVGFVTSSRTIRFRRLSIVFPNTMLFRFL